MECRKIAVVKNKEERYEKVFIVRDLFIYGKFCCFRSAHTVIFHYC